MITTLLFLGIFSVLILKWLQTNKSLPPGPILPLPILRRLFWSEFYKKNDLEIICALEKKYNGVFSVHLGYRKAVLVSDFEKVQVRVANLLLLTYFLKRYMQFHSKEGRIQNDHSH